MGSRLEQMIGIDRAPINIDKNNGALNQTLQNLGASLTPSYFFKNIAVDLPVE